jgi:signal transduction histidine kinase
MTTPLNNPVAFIKQKDSPAHTHHTVQFYENEIYLAKEVAQFVYTGLVGGEGVIIVPTPRHWELIENELSSMSCNVEIYRSTGQLVFLDAYHTLNKFMVDGMPHAQLFEQMASGVLEKLQKTFPTIRAYGEMVDVLCAQGNLDGMVALENLWNLLGKKHRFSLLCGYGIHNFASEKHGETLLKVCESHTHVLPSENFVPNSDNDSQSRTIAILQQQAASLKNEIEERKKTEAVLREKEATLKKSVKQREEFLGIVGHELKTPISSLKIQTHMARRQFEKGDKDAFGETAVLKLIDSTERQVERLTRLIDSMLDIFRVSHGKITLQHEKINLGELVREVLDRLHIQIETSGCQYRLHVETGVTGNWDRSRIEQVLVNLITNAIKYGAGNPITISISSNKTHAEISVKDEGVGIAPENLNRIFDRFERAISSTSVTGLGLGLYICKQLVAAHGGSIQAESTLGAGSTFTVKLPLSSN